MRYTPSDDRLRVRLPLVDPKSFDYATWKRLMAVNKLTVTQLADETRINRTLLTRVLSGERYPTTRMVQAIARVLKVSVAELTRIFGYKNDELGRITLGFSPHNVPIIGEIGDDCALSLVSSLTGRKIEVPYSIVPDNAQAFAIAASASKLPLSVFAGQFGLCVPVMKPSVAKLGLLSIEGQSAPLLGTITHLEPGVVAARLFNMSTVQGRSILQMQAVVHIGPWPLIPEIQYEETEDETV